MAMEAKPVRASVTQLADLMAPPDANVRGSVFGGRVLELVDKAAAVCAMRHAGKPCVTVAMDRVEFLVPIRVGEFVTAEASCHFAGRTSLEIGVDVYAEDLERGERRHTNACFVTMVAVDAKNRPSPVPALVPETREEKKRYAEAETRRSSRRRSR
jgi:acyl-CoA hydrolase